MVEKQASTVLLGDGTTFPSGSGGSLAAEYVGSPQSLKRFGVPLPVLLKAHLRADLPRHRLPDVKVLGRFGKLVFRFSPLRVSVHTTDPRAGALDEHQSRMDAVR